ncbi:MAG TPA: helix-hairpin-helix domain-containing protein, partial [Bacteroidales bacterium]
MPKFLLALLFGIFMLPNELYAQDSIENAMMSMQEIITEIASGLEDGTDMDELADLLNNLTENPIHINTATDEDLEKLFWLSEFQILNIKAYIKTYGAIASVYEIVNIQGFSEKDAKLLSPFLLFDIPGKELSVSPELLLRNSHHRLLLRSQRVLETQKGFSAEETPNGSGYFKGGPTSAYVRYSGQFNKKASAGFTAKNDAGEEFFKGSNKQGFDFYSFYMQLNRLRFIKTFVLGDYRVYFGQGLAVWSGLSFGKSPIVLSSMQRGQGITRYQSSDENNFFRGAAITCDLKPIEISLWASSHRIDANITGKDSLSGDITEVSSLQTSGLHTVSSEIADEDAIRSNVLGCNISLIKPNLRAGITAICYTYSSALNADLTPYNRYYFRGNSNYNLSWNFRYRKGNVIFFGEEAVSQSGGIAMLNGVQTYVDSRLSFIVLSRYYQRNYQSMYGKAFGENAG